MSFEDTSGRQLFGFDIQCTDSQQREILARLRATPEWRRWAVLDYQIEFGRFLAYGSEGRKLCEETSDAEIALSGVALRIITDVLR